MRLFDSDTFRSPWLTGFAVGGCLGLLSFATDDGPLPLKLLVAVGGGMFAGMRSARRHGRKRLFLQQRAGRLSGQREVPIWELSAAHDFQAEIGRRAALAEAAPPDVAMPAEVAMPRPASMTAPRSEIDERCEALERSLGISGRKF